MLVLLLIGTLFWTSESLTVSEDQPLFDDVHNLFVYFQRKFSRNYHSEAERATRFSYFQDNVQEIRRLRETNPYAEFNLTALSDLSPEEMRRRRPRHASPPPGGLLKRHRVSEPPKQSALNLSVQEIPESIDWREKGALNPVRDQMQCGSCWAFAIVAVTESQWFLKHGTLPVLSEQMLISCDRKAHDCNGAYPDSAVDGVINEYGGKMSLRSSYPYASALSYNPPCDTSLISPAAVIAGYKDLETDEHLMAQWIAHHGPIVVAIDATDLSSYHGGIITNATSKEVDHAVVAVGYGISENIPYWIVRNSWNKSWGESGYFRVLRGFGLMLINASPLAIFVQEQSGFSL